ncbi:hypothetical protein [Streptosporangium subroseum]|nr:hypothetical protein [Streptosporangium subroseum]
MTTTPSLPDSAANPLRTGADTEPDAFVRRQASSPSPRGVRRFLASRWLPVAFATVFSVVVLSAYGVSGSEISLFGAYVALGVALPGVLLVRALYPGSRTLAEEVALGVTLGYAVEVIVYIAARAAGLPLCVLVWPVTTYAAFLLVPRLRRHWRGMPRSAAPLWWSWSLALVVVYLVGWSAFTFFTRSLSWPGLGTNVDVPFHLALTGELKHHVPPTMPMVSGEPLFYHWFVYAHLASASWVTGIEPLVLLLRLAMLPMLAAFVVLIGMIGKRVIGSRAGALIAVGGTIFVAPPNLYLGTDVVFTWGGVPDLAWMSPTQTFGSLLFVLVVILLGDLFRSRGQGPGRWVVLGVSLIAVMGAKATYLPLLMVGLIAVVAAELVRRRPPWPTLAALGMTTACFVYAQFVLFGQARQGMVVDPLSFMRTAWGEWTGLGEQARPSPASMLGVTLIFVLCWLVTWSGILGLLSRPRLILGSETSLMLGIGAAGMGATLLLGHPARSQLFFLWSAYPYLVIVAVHGLLVVLRRARVSLTAKAAAAAAGLLAVYLVPFVGGVEVPLAPSRPDTVLYRPYLVLLAGSLLAAAVLTVMKGRLRAWALVTVAFAAIGLPADLHARALRVASDALGDGRTPTVSKLTARTIPQGTLTIARWLRDHSDPDDLVATNAHCFWGYENPCDSHHFWVAALSERHVLVEGWAYSSRNLDRWRPGRPAFELPFWDDERIRLNDEVFNAPSALAVQRLRERYGVDWLLADERHLGPGSKIGDFADLQIRSGDYALYRYPPR